MGKKEEALEKVKAEMEKTQDKAVLKMCRFLLSWLGFDPDSAEKIIQEKKDAAGALKHAYDVARKNNNATVNDDDVFEWAMDYFGDAAGREKLENGLMYAFLVAELEPWRPYGMTDEKENELIADSAKNYKSIEKKPETKTRGMHMSLDELMEM